MQQVSESPSAQEVVEEFLSTLPKQKKKLDKPVTVKLNLLDGRKVLLDGKELPIPLGVGRRITGEALKVLGQVYQGFTLYIANGNDWTRVRDKDVIELGDGFSFKSEDDRPRVSSSPTPHRD